MRAALIRFRWTLWLAAAALAFQALVLVLQTPMEVARGLSTTLAQAEHCEGDAAGHHGNPAQPDDICSLCLGIQVAGHGVAPTAPALPIPVAAPEPVAVLVAGEAPNLTRRTPRNPRAPPLPV